MLCYVYFTIILKKSSCSNSTTYTAFLYKTFVHFILEVKIACAVHKLGQGDCHQDSRAN